MKDEPHGNDIEHLRAKPADIVERLRVWPTIEVASVLERKLMNEAADEIERLRAENKILRTALQEIADYGTRPSRITAKAALSHD